MSDYWTTAWKYARENTCFFTPWKAIPSVLATSIQWRLFGFGTMIHAAIVIGTLLGAYVLLWLGEYGWHLLIGAPKVIYTGCVAEITAIGIKAREGIREAVERSEGQFSAELERWATSAKQTQGALADCREQLARQHPHHEEKERQVVAALGKLDDRERDFIKYLMNTGTVEDGEIQRDGHHSTIPTRIIKKIGSLLIKRTAIRPGNGLVEMGFTYEINPEVKSSLRNVLYPPAKSPGQ